MEIVEKGIPIEFEKYDMIGTFNEDKFSRTIYHKSGGIRSGDFIKNGKDYLLHGKGYVRLDNGDTFSGNYIFGILNGTGQMEEFGVLESTQQIYTGYFVNNRRQGKLYYKGMRKKRYWRNL